jgi:hypothetical protein
MGIWDGIADNEVDRSSNMPESLADAEGFEPTTSASGAQSAIAFWARFPGFCDSSECAVARESVPFCAPTGLVIPVEVVQLAWAVLEDRSATEREVKLARWLLLSALRERTEGLKRGFSFSCRPRAILR